MRSGKQCTVSHLADAGDALAVVLVLDMHSGRTGFR
jgi:hypothetical protein